MDSLTTAAARALAAGDPLGALNRVALREDPPALALRGIAMAQLGEYSRSRELLKRAARGFGARETLARARCVVAEAEVALAMRDLGGSTRPLLDAAKVLAARKDANNAMQARLIAARRLLLLGRLDEATALLNTVDAHGLSPLLAATTALVAAELALRSLRIDAAEAALARAQDAAMRARVPALLAEVAEARAALDRPAARQWIAGREHMLRLAEVAALYDSGTLVIDACSMSLRAGPLWLPLARRPLLFTLARVLAEAWPGDADRATLITRVFRIRRIDETHRARLRVEIGRLRKIVAPLAAVEATERGFRLQPRKAREVAVLMPPVDGDADALRALLADGAAWSTSALALALGASQRTVQRALADLEAAGQARAIGKGRAQRWLAPPLAGFTTILLLPAALPLA
ncbi:MAG: helix-turn-helix domain-containing protein [Burkholderiales bacterium]|nr:helix-turn-helix domain-containing protein [Burkholderiales bacterium]